jgi:hypothetical protein
MITRDLKLGEYTYKVDEFSATKRMILQFKIAKVFSSFYKNVSSAKSEQDLQKKIFEVFEQADPEESAKIIKELIMESVSAPNFKEDHKLFDKHFLSNYSHMIPLVAECFEVNYGESIQEIKKKFPIIGAIFPKFSSEDTKESE